MLIIFSYFSFKSYSNTPTIDTTHHKQDTIRHWKIKSENALGFSQLSFLNWSSGGADALASNILSNFFADYSKNKITINNYIGVSFGVQHQATFDGWRKTDDKLEWFTKWGYRASKHWDYSALLSFRTQFANGYSYPNDSVPISKFLAPAFTQLSFGMSYKPQPYFSLMISPLGGRVTVVADSLLSRKGAFGVSPGKTALWQMGGSVEALYKKDIVKNANLMMRLSLFSNYIRTPENIIVNWENTMFLRVNKYMSSTISAITIYDNNIRTVNPNGSTRGPRVQFKEAFSIGLAYKISK